MRHGVFRAGHDNGRLRPGAARRANPIVLTGETMEIESVKMMNETLSLSLTMVIKVVVLIAVLFTIAGFAIYLAGIAWLCVEEARQPARRLTRSRPERAEAGQHKAWAAPAARDNKPGGPATDKRRRKPTLWRIPVE